jgi:hypothetical protein
MKKDVSRDRKKSNFERDMKIKKVHSHTSNSKNWKRFLETADLED